MAGQTESAMTRSTPLAGRATGTWTEKPETFCLHPSFFGPLMDADQNCFESGLEAAALS